MLTKDVLKVPLTTELVVVHPNAYLHRSYKNANSMPEEKALVGTLANYHTYAPSNWTDPDPNSPRFTIDTTDKTKRFLMKFTDSSGNVVYRVIPVADIIAPKSQMDARWAVARQERADKDAKDNAIAQAKKAIEERRKQEELALRASIHDNLVALFGANYETMGIEKNWVRVEAEVEMDENNNPVTKLKTVGRIDIPVQQFLRMVERMASN